MVEIEKPRIESNEKDGDISYGKYVVEPLEHGYGTTLGNALRRIHHPRRQGGCDADRAQRQRDHSQAP